MATTQCPDCGTTISTRAAACPSCGRPIRNEGLGVTLLGMTAFMAILFALFVVAAWLGWV